MKSAKLLFVSLVAGAVLGNPGVAVGADRVQMLTAPTGSIVHTVGSSIASVVSRNTDMEMLALPMAGPQVYVPQINSGQAEFTLMNALDSYEALRGGADYQASYKNLRLAGVGFTNELGVLVPKDSDIHTGEDLRGKRVTGVFSAHKTCRQLSTAALANFGLTWDDVEVVPVTHSKTASKALGEGRVDAALCVAMGQAVVEEVNARIPVRFLSLDDSPEAVERTKEAFPAGRLIAYEAGKYTGLVKDTNIWSYPFYLVAGADVSDETVYRTVEAIYENIDELRNISGVFKRWYPEQMIGADITLPVHPGARRFYEEKGMWTDEVQAADEHNFKKIAQ